MTDTTNLPPLVQQDNGICAPLPDDTALRTLSRLNDEMGEDNK